MKKNNIYISICFIFIMSSCSGFLDKEPLNNPSDQTFLSSGTEMDMAITGCYSLLWTDIESMPFYLAFDNATDISYERNASNLQLIGQGAMDAENIYAKSIWKNFYAGISRCNYLIENMEKGKETVVPEKYTQIEAEARFLRALYYSYLVELYGDIPLVKENRTLETPNQSRTPKKEVVDFILSEFT